MEQIIEEEEKKRKVCKQIEEQYQVTILQHGKMQSFITDNSQSREMVQLAPYSAAIRRNPPLPGANRLPCMADVVRVDTCLMEGIIGQGTTASKEKLHHLLTSAVQYQKEMQIPFTCMTVREVEELRKNEIRAEELGFHCIYEQEQINLRYNMISKEMLRQARAQEKVRIVPLRMDLQVLDRSQLVSLAHFSNALLCRKYGLFMIRSTVYFEKLQQECRSRKGDIYIIQEKGKIKGYFVSAKEDGQQIQEAFFEENYVDELLLDRTGLKEPAMFARIVNLKEMLRHVSSHGKVSIAVTISDPMIPENDGLFVWYLSAQESHVVPIEEKDGYIQKPELSVTIGELTAFFFEYNKLKENIKFDSIYLSGPAYLNEQC